MGNFVESISRICVELSSGDVVTAGPIAEQELATPSHFNHRRYTAKEQTSIFLRDGFIDRFTADRLVFPPVLLLVSLHLKIQFPYHPNLQPPECHPMYWDLQATVVGVTEGIHGRLPVPADSDLVTTSIRRAAVKGDRDAAAFGWTVYPAGDLSRWDGLMKWFVGLAEKTNTFESEDFFRGLQIDGEQRKSNKISEALRSWYFATRGLRDAI